MNISEASAIIQLRHDQRVISSDIAAKAQIAIREKSYYGNTMTSDDRRRLLANRFGIVADGATSGVAA